MLYSTYLSRTVMRRVATICLLILGYTTYHAPAVQASDLVLYNAKIYTQNDQHPWAEAIVAEAGKIVYVGNSEDAKRYINDQSQAIDLKGKLVIPGLIDAHMHPGVVSLMSQLGVILLGESGPKDYVQAIKEYADSNPDAKVIAGFGFFPERFDNQGPRKELLDAVVPDRPVFIVSGWGHSAWANSKALELLDINKDTPDPFPGAHQYRRDSDGEPTGHLIEGAAFWAHLKRLGLGSIDQFKAGYADFLPSLSTIGITTVFDAGTPNVQENAYQALMALEQENKLNVRYMGSNYLITQEEADNAVATMTHLQQSYSSTMVKPVSHKISNDGIALFGDYFLQFQEDELTNILSRMAKNNQDSMIHSIHPEAIHVTINAIEKALQAQPDTHSRFTLTHSMGLKPEDYERVAKLKIVINAQPQTIEELGSQDYHQHALTELGDNWHGEFAKNKTLLDLGVILSSSSDFPACGAPGVEFCSPFHGMEAAVTRSPIGSDYSVPSEDEKLSVAEALKTYTINAAYQLRLENETGSLEVGKLADMAILNQNLFDIDHNEIHTTQVDMTIVNGKVVYEASVSDKIARSLKITLMDLYLRWSKD